MKIVRCCDDYRIDLIIFQHLIHIIIRLCIEQ